MAHYMRKSVKYTACTRDQYVYSCVQRADLEEAERGCRKEDRTHPLESENDEFSGILRYQDTSEQRAVTVGTDGCQRVLTKVVPRKYVLSSFATRGLFL